MSHKPPTSSANNNIPIDSSTEFLDSILENAGTLLLILDKNGHIIRFNKACEILSGYSFDEVKGKLAWDILLPSSNAELISKDTLEDLILNPQIKIGHYSNCWQTKDDICHYIDWYNTLLIDDEGQIKSIICSGVDITEYKQAQSDLYQATRNSELQELRNQVILSTTMEGFALADMQGKFIDVNPAYENMLGYSRGELLQLSIKDIEIAQDPETIKKRLKYIAETGHDRFTTRHRRKDGSGIDIEANTSIAKIGDETYVYAFIRDITVQKQIELELREAKDAAEQLALRNDKILHITLDGFMVVDINGNIVDVNPAYESILGYNRYEFLHMRVADIEAFENHEDILKRIEFIKQQGYARFESTQRRKDGQLVDVEVSVSYMHLGNNEFSFAFVRDITERKRAEQELRSAKDSADKLVRRNKKILDTTLDGFITLNTQSNIIDSNPAYLNMIGYSRDELLGMSIADIDALDNPENVKKRTERINKLGYSRFESKHRHKNGSLIDVDISVSLIEFDDQKFHFAFIRDITASKRVEKELRLAKETAENASRAKSEFLSRMSHELRTPMNAILGFTQLLEIEPLSDQQNMFLIEIINAGQHLLHLINELLDLTRIEAGRLTIDIEPVAVAPVIENVISIIQPMISEKNLSVSMDCTKSIVNADSMRLKQILLNLLSNASKYNRQGGEIIIHCEEQNDKILRISIEDTGIGINSENQEKLFTPFERLDAAHKGIDGTGIGLVICRHLAEMMKGKIGLSSKEGKGSTFWFDLPLSDFEVKNVDIDIQREIFSHSDLITVLYVEDNVANMNLLKNLFKYHPNIKLSYASTGDEGLELIKSTLPDVVILDIHLPGMNGFDVLDAMRDDPLTRDIPVIGLSADAMPSDIKKALQSGFDRYLTKPVDIKLLITEITTLADKIL